MWVNLFVAAISLEKGVEGLVTSKKPITSAIYCKIFDEISKNGENYILFGDNATWHVSAHSKKEMELRKLEFIRNVAYCPDLNPIEKFFR